MLWLKQHLLDFDIKLEHIPIMCDYTSVINLTKHTVLHLRIKHTEIRHHFLCNHIEKWDVIFEHADNKNKLADIFIKSFPIEPFLNIRRELGILNNSNFT